MVNNDGDDADDVRNALNEDDTDEIRKVFNDDENCAGDVRNALNGDGDDADDVRNVLNDDDEVKSATLSLSSENFGFPFIVKLSIEKGMLKS